MLNRIRDLVVMNHRLDPVETELAIHVLLETLTPATELKGRLTGPRCAYSSTIEIAHSVRKIQRSDHIELRVSIPEPSWWEPETPFLYAGSIELWQEAEFCQRVPIVHGIRWLQLTSKGLRLNGRQFTLRGKLVELPFSEPDAIKLHEQGINAVLTATPGPHLAPWQAADRAGLFVIGTSDLETFLLCRNELTAHPSNFGWLFNRADLAKAPIQQEGLAMFYGINSSAESRPANADFLVCHENELSWLDDAELPKLVIANRLPDLLPSRPDVIGWIESA